jgi:hypothetical protein
MTEAEYLEAKARLDAMHKAIDEAPMDKVPVFEGIVKLHTRVHRYEREHAVKADR